MKFFHLSCLFLAGFFGTIMNAQTDAVLSVPTLTATNTSSSICTPVVADTFRNITAAQFSLSWDETTLEFKEVRLGNNPLGLDASGTSMPASDRLRVAYVTSDGNGLTLTPGTTLMEICYTPRLAEGTSAITFDGGLRPEFAREGSFEPIPFDTIPGRISYGPSQATTVLPGDTDNNAQVDHRDLLNIGFLHGTTGPARNDAATNFAPQPAMAWSGTLNSGPNQAIVDADGNGTIDNNDVAVINQNYALVADGNFEFAPTVATPAGPALTLTTEQALDAGQEGTLIVSLGDGATAGAAAYALAFTLQFDPAQIDPASIMADFSNSFFGNDLLTLARLNVRANGILEVALSRKDQANTPVAGGEVVRFTFNTIPQSNSGDFATTVSIFPNAFLRADQTAAPINSGTASFAVSSTSSVVFSGANNPVEVYPNPASDNIRLRDVPQVAGLFLSIFNQWGQRVVHAPYRGQAVSVRDLPSGTYLLQLTDGEQRWVNPLVVNRQP